MGCIIRQKMVACPGLSHIVKEVLAGKDIYSIDVGVSEVPNSDLRSVLEKVSS